jgi:hypothetical protein
VLQTILDPLPVELGDSLTFASVLFLIMPKSSFAMLQLLIFSEIAVGLSPFYIVLSGNNGVSSVSKHQDLALCDCSSIIESIATILAKLA